MDKFFLHIKIVLIIVFAAIICALPFALVLWIASSGVDFFELYGRCIPVVLIVILFEEIVRLNKIDKQDDSCR